MNGTGLERRLDARCDRFALAVVSGNDMDADIACAADELVGHRTVEPLAASGFFGAADNDMGDIACRCVADDFLGLIGARAG